MDNGTVKRYRSSISVIIPCYNAEKTIKRALLSLERQTYDSFEVVIINDGSTDGTDRAIKDYMKGSKLDFIYLIFENSGVSNARNKGLDYAKGGYILFLDADDVYHSDFIRLMYETLIENNVDTVCCSFTRKIDYLLAQTGYVSDIKINIVEQKCLMKLYMYRKIKANFPSFIYKSEIVQRNSIKFTPGLRYGEDREFLWKYMSHCKKGAIINSELYGYYNNPKSVFNNPNWNKIDSLISTKNVEKYLKEKKNEFYPIFKNYMHARTMWGVAKALALGKEEKLYSRLYSEYDVKSCMRVLIKKDPNFLVRITAFIYFIHPKLFLWLIKAKYKCELKILNC